MSPGAGVAVVRGVAELAEEAATYVAAVVLSAPPGRRAAIALAGGSTPRAAYRRLAARRLPWERVELFFGDERCVSPDDPASNYAMARESLLDHVPLPEGRVHRIPGELDPAEAAARAEADVRAALPDAPVPRLDLALLGIGEDGHTASLFPGAPELEERERLLVPVHRAGLPQPWRVTMTLPVLNAARRVLVLAAGGGKAAAVARAVAGDPALPAGRLRPEGGALTWLVTRDAAGRLPAGAGPRGR